VLHIGIGQDKITDMVQLLVQNHIEVSAVIPKTSLEDLYLSKLGTESQI
jgi:hypothetical protein